MAVSLLLTTTQKPVFDKIMKAAKVKVASEGTRLEFEADTYAKAMDAVQDAWMKAHIQEPPADDTILTQVIGKMAMIGNLFAHEIDAKDIGDPNDVVILSSDETE